MAVPELSCFQQDTDMTAMPFECSCFRSTAWHSDLTKHRMQEVVSVGFAVQYLFAGIE